jgi:hypothetical protein
MTYCMCIHIEALNTSPWCMCSYGCDVVDVDVDVEVVWILCKSDFHDCNMGMCIRSLYRLGSGNVDQVWLENEQVGNDEECHDETQR